MPKLSVLRVREVRNKVGNREASKMEHGPQQHSDTADGTEFREAMSNGSVFICTARLVVLRVI